MKRSSPGKNIKLLLVDDHPVVIQGVLQALGAHPGLKVVGVARTGEEALRKAQRCRSDVVVMNLKMPGMDGLETTKRLRRALPGLKILIFTGHVASGYVLQAIRAGACGYLLKDATPRELVLAIKSVARDTPFFSPRLPTAFLTELVKNGGRPPVPPVDELSSREAEVLALLAGGYSNSEMAQRLFVSVRTVETHRTNIMRKLDLHNLADLTRYAIAQGIIAAI